MGIQIRNCAKLAKAFARKAPLTLEHLQDAANLQKQRLEVSEREKEERTK
jgi:hypothetical protein